MVPIQEFNKPSLIRKKVQLEAELNRLNIQGYPFGSIIAHHLDIVYLKRDKPNMLSERLKETVFSIRQVFYKNNLSINQDVLLISSNKKDQRFSLLFDPVQKLLNREGISNIHLSGSDFFRVINFQNIILALIYVLKYSAILINGLQRIKQHVDLSLKSRLAIIVHTYNQLLLLLSVRSVLSKSKEKFVLVDWDKGPYQSLICLAQRKLGKLSATLVHGTITIPTKFVPLIAEEVWHWGSNHSDFFREYNKGSLNESCVGFSKFSLPSTGDSNTIKQQYSVDGKQVISYIDKGDSTIDNHFVAKEFSTLMAALPGEYLLLIKPHPAADLDDLQRAFKQVDRSIVLDKDVTAKSVLSISSLAIIVDSTFTLDALFYGVPVVFYDPREQGVHGLIKSMVDRAGAYLFQEMGNIKDYILQNASNYKTSSNYDLMLEQAKLVCEYQGENSAQRILEKIKERINKE